jgi:hypothetical protein
MSGQRLVTARGSAAFDLKTSEHVGIVWGVQNRHNSDWCERPQGLRLAYMTRRQEFERQRRTTT